MDDLEKKNFFKIERLEAELKVLKDQYKLLTEQQRLDIEKKPESEVTPDLKAVVIELAAGIYSTLNTKINSLNKDILLLKNQYELLTEEQPESEEGLDLEMAFFKLNAKVNSLNDDILALKDQYELLTEGQRLNTQKITELFDMLELKYTKEAVKEVVFDDKENEKKAYQIYADGRNQFIVGNYDEAIALFKSYLDGFPNYKNVADAKLWLGRAYFANELYSQSRAIYLEFQSENPQHAKYPDSMYELSRVFFELGELEASKTMLIKMIEKFPTHDLYKKVKQMLTELEELTIDA
jgi:TolA-binding protein